MKRDFAKLCRRVGLGRPFVRGLFWFVVLWLAGVAATALLALPFRLLVGMATHG